MIIAYLISNPQFNICNISYITSQTQRLSHFVTKLKYMVGGQVNPVIVEVSSSTTTTIIVIIIIITIILVLVFKDGYSRVGQVQGERSERYIPNRVLIAVQTCHERSKQQTLGLCRSCGMEREQ